MMIKRRNLFLQALWFILTLSLYAFYWFYATSKEMAEYLARPNAKDEPILWTLLMLIPIACLYPMYKHGELFETLTDRAVDRWVIFLLWFFFPPATWYIIQRKLNELADQQKSRAPLPGEPG